MTAITYRDDRDLPLDPLVALYRANAWSSPPSRLRHGLRSLRQVRGPALSGPETGVALRWLRLQTTSLTQEGAFGSIGRPIDRSLSGHETEDQVETRRVLESATSRKVARIFVGASPRDDSGMPLCAVWVWVGSGRSRQGASAPDLVDHVMDFLGVGEDFRVIVRLLLGKLDESQVAFHRIGPLGILESVFEGHSDFGVLDVAA